MAIVNCLTDLKVILAKFSRINCPIMQLKANGGILTKGSNYCNPTKIIGIYIFLIIHNIMRIGEINILIYVRRIYDLKYVDLQQSLRLTTHQNRLPYTILISGKRQKYVENWSNKHHLRVYIEYFAINSFVCCLNTC